MADTIYRNFMKLEDAESARNALLASRFPSPAVKFTPHQRVDRGGEQVVATANRHAAQVAFGAELSISMAPSSQ
jgi:hypothetical protein